MRFHQPNLLTMSIIVASLGLTACNSNDHDTAATATFKTLTVAPSLGRIANARVILRDAVSHQAIGDAPLSASGSATFNVPANVSAVIAEVAPLIGGAAPTYFDEGTGSNQPLPANTQLRAAFTLPNTVSEVGITPLTEAAVRRAQALAGGGADPVLTVAQIGQANAQINQAFGVTNILQAPILIGSDADYTQLLSATNQAGRDYALRLAALARQAKDALPANSSSPAVTMMNALASDLADGQLDHAGTGFPTTDVPYANVAAFAQSWTTAMNTLATAVLANVQSGLTTQQITAFTAMFSTLASSLTINPNASGVVSCSTFNLPEAHAPAIAEFVGSYTVDIFAGASVKTGVATLVIAANGEVTLDSQLAHPTAICGPSTQGGTGYLIVTDRVETGKTSKAMVNLFKDSSNLITVEGVNFAGAANTVYSGSKAGSGNVTPLAVTGLSPASGAVGSTVTITGTGFDADVAHMVVQFATNIGAEIVSATATQLVVKVPAGAVSGAVKVTNGLTNTTMSSTASFSVQPATGGGNAWTARTLPFSFVSNSIAFGNGTYVIVGAGGGIFTSTDGISWTTRSAANSSSTEFKSVIYDGSQFVAVGNTFNSPTVPPRIATSPDGITWTARSWTVSPSLTEYVLSDITVGGGRLTAVGANGVIITSTDSGVTWTNETQTSIASFSGVASNGTMRVGVGRNGGYNGVIINNDGTAWSLIANNMTDFYPRDIVWTGSQFVAVGGDTSNLVPNAASVTMTSADGIHWARHTVANAPAGQVFMSVVWDGSKLYAVGGDSGSNRMIMSSTDGIVWAAEFQSTGYTFAGVAASPSGIVAVGGTKSVTKP